MSEENVEIVRRVYDAAARRDTAAVLALYDPDVEWDNTQTGPGGLTQRGIFHGHEGIRNLYREWHEVWENYTEDSPEELIDAGDRVISVGTVRARGRASGAEVELHVAGIWAIREGKVVRVAWFPTRAEALEAAGLSE